MKRLIYIMKALKHYEILTVLYSSTGPLLNASLHYHVKSFIAINNASIYYFIYAFTKASITVNRKILLSSEKNCRTFLETEPFKTKEKQIKIFMDCRAALRLSCSDVAVWKFILYMVFLGFWLGHKNNQMLREQKLCGVLISLFKVTPRFRKGKD